MLQIAIVAGGICAVIVAAYFIAIDQYRAATASGGLVAGAPRQAFVKQLEAALRPVSHLPAGAAIQLRQKLSQAGNPAALTPAGFQAVRYSLAAMMAIAGLALGLLLPLSVPDYIAAPLAGAREHGRHGGRAGPAPPCRIDRAVGPDGRSYRAASPRPGDRDEAPPAPGCSGARGAGLLAHGLSDGRLHLPRLVDRPPRSGHHPGLEVASLMANNNRGPRGHHQSFSDLDKPLYTISVAAEILQTHPRTLM